MNPRFQFPGGARNEIDAETFSNKLYHMDCMELFSHLPDGCVSMILTDPPYGIRYQNNFTRHPHPPIAGDAGIDYDRFAGECYRILQNNTHAYFFTRFDCYPHHYDCLRRAGFAVKNCMVVEKGNIGGIGDLRGSYANNAEWIVFCQKGRRIFQSTTLLENRKKEGTLFRPGANPSKRYKTRFNACWFGEEYPKSTYSPVWQKKHQIFHPTIKNVEFLSWLIQISSQPGELIFDGFMGSGSTAVAAITTGRRYLGAEINQKYFEIAQQRIAQAQGGERNL